MKELKASVSLPEVAMRRRAVNPQLRDIAMRSRRLRAAAADAEDKARRLEKLARRHNLVAEYAAAAARAAEVERAHIAATVMDSARGQNIRRRLLRDRERAENLAAVGNGAAGFSPTSRHTIPYW